MSKTRRQRFSRGHFQISWLMVYSVLGCLGSLHLVMYSVEKHFTRIRVGPQCKVRLAEAIDDNTLLPKQKRG